MSRLVLPGDAPAGMRQLYVPHGHETAPPVFAMTCLLCGERFEEAHRAHEFQRHVNACARRNMDEIQAEVERRRKSVFHEDAWDPEVAAHMRKVGERMIEEGRLEVKPSERAGF